MHEVQSKREESNLQQINQLKEEMKRDIVELQRKIVDVQEEKTKLIKEFVEKEESFEKEKTEMEKQIQQMHEWNADTVEKQSGDKQLKASVKQLREQILQYKSQLVNQGAKLDAAVQENTEMAEAFRKAKMVIKDYEKKNPDLAALRKEIEDRDTTIQVMWIENEDLKAELVKLRGGAPSPSVDRSPAMSPAVSQVSIPSVSSCSSRMSPAASQVVLTETVTPIRVESYQTAVPGVQYEKYSSINGADTEIQELDQLRKKDAENIDMIARLTKELEVLRAGGSLGSFVSGEHIISQSPAHEDSPLVFQLRRRLKDLEKQKEDLIHQRRELEAKLDLEVQTSNEEKRKLTRQVTEWRDWYQTLSVQLADYEQDIKQLKQLKEEKIQNNAQLTELSGERDKLTEELKQAKRSLLDLDQKHPNIAQVRKQMEEMRTTLQVHWIENEQLKKQLEEYQVKGVPSSAEEVTELRRKLQGAEEQLSVLKQSAVGETTDSNEANLQRPTVNVFANMTQTEMQEHYKAMNTNLALAVAEKQGLLNKVKELEQKLAETNFTESAAASKPTSKDGRKTSRGEKFNLVMENQALQSKVQNLDTQLKETKKVEQDVIAKSTGGKPGRKGLVKEDRLSVSERQTFQNKITELECQLKEAKKTTKETPSRPKPTPKKSAKDDSLLKEEIKNLKAKIQASAEEKESMKSTLKGLETQLKIEQIEKTSLLGCFKEQETQLELEQCDAGSGAKQSSRQRRKHHKELVAMQRKYDEELTEVKKQLEETRIQYASEVELLQNEHSRSLERLKELEKQQKEVCFSGHSSQSDAETTPCDSKEKIHKLTSELQRVKADRDILLRSSDCSETTEFELHELKVRVDLLENEKVKMFSIIEHLEKEKQEAVAAKQYVLSEKEELVQKIKVMELHEDSYAKYLSAAECDQKTALGKANSVHNAVLQMLKSELEQLKADHKIELDGLRKELECLKVSKGKEESAPEGAAHAVEEQLEQTKASHQSVIQMLMSELDQLKIDHKAKLEMVKSDMKRLRKESSELKHFRSDTFASDEVCCTELRARLEEMKAERDTLEDRVRTVEAEKDTLETESLKLITEMKQEYKVSATRFKAFENSVCSQIFNV